MERQITAKAIGVILASYSVGMCIMSFGMDALHVRLGTKATYILGVSFGAVVCLLAISLNYSSIGLFICAAAALRFLDGARETMFEVVAFVYFAENVLPCTTEKMQGRAISIYKVVGSVGFLVGSLQGPLFLETLGYDGSWCVFLAIYIVAVTLSCLIYPKIGPSANSESKHETSREALNEALLEPSDDRENDEDLTHQLKDVSFFRVFCMGYLWPCYISIFFGLYALMGIAAPITMHLVEDFGFEAEVAYYFFAVWSSGQIIGNCFAPCMIPHASGIMRLGMAAQIVGLALAGPSNTLPFLTEKLGQNQILIVNAVGLFIMGLSSAALQTIGNIESVVRA